MDIITKQDCGVSTETVGHIADECKSVDNLQKSVSTSTAIKTEKKKSESKKLKKKLIEVEEQKESLTKMLNDKNSEILELRKSVNSLNEVLNSVPIDELRCNSSIASAKILELSKKNRQLRAELETTKNRLAKRDQQIQKLEKDMEIIHDKMKLNTDFSKNGVPSPLEEMHSKISALRQKLFETRNKNAELNNQLKLAHKCLQQEIGENFNLNLLANQSNSSNWRGRAQQILHLQQKIKELQERLDKYGQATALPPLEPETCTDFPSTKLPSSTSFGSLERPIVRKTEIQHRAKVESLEKEIINLKTEIEEQRSKMLALKVRNKNLNDEITRLRMKENSLEEQTDFNNINVATLNDRLIQQKAQYEKRIEDLSRESEKLNRKFKEMELQNEFSKDKIQEMEIILQEKDKTIDELTVFNKKLEEDLKAICGDFLFSCREFRKEEFIGILDSLEAEKNSLLAHNQTLNERVNQERTKNNSLMEQMSKQKIRITRLEVKVRDLEHDLDMQSEKKKRSQRIAEYTASLSNMSSACSVNSFTFENTSLNSTARSNGDELDNVDIIDLKNRLELANEKITILKEKLDHIMKEKETDIKTFQEVFANSKNIILETILAHHNNIQSEDL